MKYGLLDTIPSFFLCVPGLTKKRLLYLVSPSYVLMSTLASFWFFPSPLLLVDATWSLFHSVVSFLFTQMQESWRPPYALSPLVPFFFSFSLFISRIFRSVVPPELRGVIPRCTYGDLRIAVFFFSRVVFSSILLPLFPSDDTFLDFRFFFWLPGS